MFFLPKRPLITPPKVAAGKGYSFLIKDDTLYSSGSFTKTNTFTKVASGFRSVTSHYGITLDNTLIDLFTSKEIAKGVSGVFPVKNHLFYIINGVAYKDHNPLPVKNVIKVVYKPPYHIFLKENGELVTDDPELELPKKAQDINAEPFITTSYWGFASNSLRATSVASSNTTLCLYNSAHLHTRGSSVQGQLGLPKGHYDSFHTHRIHGIRSIGLSDSHTILSTSSGFFTSGSNRKGELGLGDYNTRFAFTKVSGLD